MIPKLAAVAVTQPRRPFGAAFSFSLKALRPDGISQRFPCLFSVLKCERLRARRQANSM